MQKKEEPIMPDPIIVPSAETRGANQNPISAIGMSLVICEWSGSGPDYLHVHHSDDEAWHVLSGTLTFRFLDKQIVAKAGTTVFVPAGVAHSYVASEEPARYLIIMTPRLNDLITALHAAPREQHNTIMQRFDSEIVEL
jgi:quercetin dioxygenase-like cupin family protein